MIETSPTAREQSRFHETWTDRTKVFVGLLLLPIKLEDFPASILFCSRYLLINQSCQRDSQAMDLNHNPRSDPTANHGPPQKSPTASQPRDLDGPLRRHHSNTYCLNYAPTMTAKAVKKSWTSTIRLGKTSFPCVPVSPHHLKIKTIG